MKKIIQRTGSEEDSISSLSKQKQIELEGRVNQSSHPSLDVQTAGPTHSGIDKQKLKDDFESVQVGYFSLYAECDILEASKSRDLDQLIIWERRPSDYLATLQRRTSHQQL